MSDKQPLGPNQTFWLKELRSGKYEQWKTDLCRNGKYCCLGVAAEIFATGQTEIPITKGIKYFDICMSSAPNYVMEALSLYRDLGETSRLVFGPDSLAHMNDHGKTFAEIADIIEEDPSVYFKEPR